MSDGPVIVLALCVKLPCEDLGGNGKHLPCRIGREEHDFTQGRVIGNFLQLNQFSLGLLKLTQSDKCHPPGIVPDSGHKGTIRSGGRQLRDFIPLPKTCQGVIGNHQKGLQQRQLIDGLIRNLAEDLVRRIKGNGAASFHGRRRPQKVNVVRIVAQRIDPLGPALGDITFVGRNSLLIDVRSVGVPTDPQVNMGRHVNQVPGSRDQAPEPVCSSLGPLRPLGRLKKVNVVMVGSRVLRIPRHYRLENRDCCLRTRVGTAVPGPVVPGAKVHQGFCINGGGIEIVGIPLRQLLHGIGEGLITWDAIFCLSRIAGGQGIDIGLLPLRSLSF